MRLKAVVTRERVPQMAAEREQQNGNQQTDRASCDFFHGNHVFTQAGALTSSSGSH